jgi:imidazolonepropionase-like amidohydrolase
VARPSTGSGHESGAEPVVARPSTGSGHVRSTGSWHDSSTGSGQAASTGSGPERLHLRGTVLPEGDVRDLWIQDGLISAEPVRGATTIATDLWLMPGLVDAHCHVGLDADGAVPAATAEQQALADRAAGALLLRDAGSPADTRWIDARDDLPKIIRAGRHIARPLRYLRNYGDEVDPAELVTAVERQSVRGDGWVKLVGDWIDRELGDLTPLWPVDVAAAAIARAHELGVRVTAHVFGEQAAAELVRAGIDGIEHGTGLDVETLAIMAERGVALVPTLVQLENFESFAAAGEPKFPAYAKHMRQLYARRIELFRTAYELGVPIFAGTDAGGFLGHGLIGDELVKLTEILPADEALGAGSWRARRWLGRHDSLADGVPADLVAFDEDPRRDPDVLRHPRLVVLRGRVVESR